KLLDFQRYSATFRPVRSRGIPLNLPPPGGIGGGISGLPKTDTPRITTMALTDRACKMASPREKDYKLADEIGMYLLVTRTGGKYWRWKYRFVGKEKVLALGVYPETGLKVARDLCIDARRQLVHGI